MDADQQRSYAIHEQGTYVVFEESDALGEQASTDEEQQVGGSDQEPAESDGRSTAVDDVTDDRPGNDTNNDGNRNRRCGLTERDLPIMMGQNGVLEQRNGSTHTTNKDDSFKPFSNKSDEGQQEQGPLAASSAPLGQGIFLGVAGHGMNALVESLGQLDPPFYTGSIHLEESETHKEDDDGRKEGEDTFPDLFGFGPQVGQGSVELRKQGVNIEGMTFVLMVTYDSDESGTDAE